MSATYQNLIRPAAVALLLSAFITTSLCAEADLPAELDQALQEAGQAGDVFDPARLFRLEALVRLARTPEQLRLIETRLVKVLGSEAPLAAKQDICRVLWQIGSAQSAPALQKLLGQPETVEIACYAIANNPVPELGQAARDALVGSTGKVALSLLNLLGQRGDTNAVRVIAPFLQNESPDVAVAAAVALGKIGGPSAVAALGKFRQTVPQDRRVKADDAYLRALEGLDPAGAIPVWKELVPAKGESAPIRRGALLELSQHAPEAAAPWLLAALREQDKALRPVTGSALRHLRSQPAIAQVVAGLPEFSAPSQVIVLESLGVALPAETLVAVLHQSDVSSVRLSALRMLGTQGGARAVEALLAEALSPTATQDRREILQLLKGLPGPAVTEAILQTLPKAPGPLLPDLTQLLVARGAQGLVTPLLERAITGDTAARLAAIRALRFAAAARDHAALFQLLTSAATPEIHEAVEESITDIFSRSGEAQQHADWLLQRLDSPQRPEDRQSFLRLLAQTGTPAALQRVLEQVHQGGEPDREVAFRALTQWPNDAALEPLLGLAGGQMPEAQRTALLRGAVRLLQESQWPAPKKVEFFRRLTPLSANPANRKLLLSGLAQVHHAGALELIMPSLDDPAVRTEAAMAAIAVASNLGPGDDAVVNAAMTKVLAVVPDAELRAQALVQIRAPRPPLPDVYLDALQPLRAVSGNDGGKGRPQHNRNCIGQPLKLKGVTYQRGVGEHASAELTYEIKPGYTRFVCVVGLDDQVARFNDVRGSIVIKVLGDDYLLAQTPVLRGGGASANIDVPIPAGAKALRLVVGDAGDGVGFDDADFVNAGFISGPRDSAVSTPPPAAKNEEGFAPLFDGRTLAGWEGNLQVFQIQDRAIVGGSLQTPVPRNEFLCTTNVYSDFELRLKFKLLGAEANGGVQIRSRRVPGNEVSGYQADLGQSYWGNLYDESRRNKILVQADQAELRKVLRPNDWNDYRIRCEGRRIQLWINGHQTVDYAEPDEKLEQTGLIGVQIHGGPPSEAWYKDIAIKRRP